LQRQEDACQDIEQVLQEENDKALMMLIWRTDYARAKSSILRLLVKDLTLLDTLGSTCNARVPYFMLSWSYCIFTP